MQKRGAKGREEAEQLSLGQEIIAGLTEFVEVLKSGKKLSDHFRTHRVRLVLKTSLYTPQTVKAARQTLGASQAVFASFLGVSVKTVRAWEQGASAPSEIARRFMDEIRNDPKYWRGRLRSLLVAG